MRQSQIRRPVAIGLLCLFVWAALTSSSLSQTLRSNLRDDVPNVDPASFNGPVGHRLLSLVYEGLTAFTEDGQVIPALATGWETPDGGRSWRFHLRPGVRFHSGRALSADDVRASFETVLRAKRPSFSAQFLEKLEGRSAFADGRTDHPAGFVILDPLTFELRFTEPMATFPVYPCFIFDGAAAATWGANWFNSHSGGTGPFKLTQWRRGRDAQLEVNSDYWGERPAVDGLRLLAVSSVETALAMFDAGELDFVTATEPAHRLVAGDPRRLKALQAVERMQARFLAMNPALYPPFADQRVRAAVSLVIDRQAVVDGVYGGLASMPEGYGAAALMRGGKNQDKADSQALIIHRHDPSAARELLAAAGYPGGRGLPPLELAVIDSARNEGAYYADQLAKILGLPVTLRSMERAAILAAANAGTLPFFLAGWTADFPEPLTYLDSLWRSGSRFNQARWSDPDYDGLVDQARGAADPAARRRLYRLAERRLADTAAVAMLPTPFNMLLRNEAAAAKVAVTAYGHLAFAPRAGAAKP